MMTLPTHSITVRQMGFRGLKHSLQVEGVSLDFVLCSPESVKPPSCREWRTSEHSSPEEQTLQEAACFTHSSVF